ncbi:NADPH:quinone oxidoreductase family protein [Thiomonas sp. FB-6]|uniref:NADPH:quinone oxidoreductase family protein n=1 Tax=Thiomonas sp. FB-6 TaxID=1158291 RepID=UPI0003A89B95|nr:NADPH:quinone oxidoreductase family protein [Thiomonas sp. FB-6]
MQALMCHAFGPISGLRLEQAPDPVPAAGQVRVRVRACSLNFPDALIVQGLYQVKPALPFSPGAEFAGVVEALGEGVQQVSVGDPVVAFAGHGGLAERCVVDAARLLPLPPGMDFAQGAAFLLTYGTALHALRTIAGLRAGQTLLVLGAAGGVGLAAVEVGKALGARVLAAASSAERLELARHHGADAGIDYATQDLRRRVLELSDGRGADVVLDPVGGSYAESALRATAWRGSYLVVGFAAGEIPRLPLNLLLLQERRLLGVYWGEALQRDPAAHLRDVEQLVQWFAQGRLRPPITERVGLDGALGALQRMAARQLMGKVVVELGAQEVGAQEPGPG